MDIQTLIEHLNQGPVDFHQVMEVIDAHYDFMPTEFKNGDQINQADTNNGSCKIFAFAQLNQLTKQSSLNAFGDFYTQDVLENPTGKDHANIRNFMVSGWEGIEFSGVALTAK